MDIQHEPKVLQRFKLAHEPLVKALSNFENMENHGESIKLVICQLITWTLHEEGITLLESLVVLVQVLKPYYNQGWWFESIFTQTLILL
jgi:hypothetical protein